jgi:hypothetical protein
LGSLKITPDSANETIVPIGIESPIS